MVAEAREILAALLPLADTLPPADRRFLRSWQRAIERGREIQEGQMVWLRKLKEAVERGHLKAGKAA